MSTTLSIPLEISFVLSVDPRRSTLHDVQRDIRCEARRTLARALVTAIARVEKALLASPVLCAACGVRMRSRGRGTRKFTSVFGAVQVHRNRYGCPRCGAVRRPLDEWLGFVPGTECTAFVREQALYLAADLPYERAAEALRRVGGIGLSGRQIQRLLEAESQRIETVLGGGTATARAARLRPRFRRGGNAGQSAGARRVLQLRRLRSSGLWDAYWAGRLAVAPEGVGSHPARASRADTRMR